MLIFNKIKMKKLKVFIFTVLVTIGFVTSCSKDESSTDNKQSSLLNEEVKRFIDSENFKNSPYHNMSINFQSSTINYVKEEGLEIPVISIVFGENKKVNGVIQAIRLTNKKSVKKRLPNNNDYAMLYFNTKNYNPKTKTGELTVHDVNFDNSKIHSVKFKNSKVIEDRLSRINPTTLKKYNYYNNETFSSKSIPNSCSGGANGNVSWGECYHCLTTICESDVDCNGLLNSVDVLGQVSGYGAIGSLSIGAACVYIAATR